MDDIDYLIYIIFAFFAVLFLSRLISFVLGSFLLESRYESEFWTFLISFLIDAVLMYVMVKAEHHGGVPETVNIVFVKAFPFILFYILGVGMFDCCVNSIVNFTPPPVW